MFAGAISENGTGRAICGNVTWIARRPRGINVGATRQGYRTATVRSR